MIEHTWRLAPRWVIVARFVAAIVVVALVIAPILLALHTTDVRNNRRAVNQARIDNLNAIERANAQTAARLKTQQRMLDQDAARLDRQQKELAHGLALTEFKACAGRNALREQLVVIVSASPTVTADQVVKFRSDLGFEKCPPKPAPLPPEPAVSPPTAAAPRSTTTTTRRATPTTTTTISHGARPDRRHHPKVPSTRKS